MQRIGGVIDNLWLVEGAVTAEIRLPLIGWERMIDALFVRLQEARIEGGNPPEDRIGFLTQECDVLRQKEASVEVCGHPAGHIRHSPQRQ